MTKPISEMTQLELAAFVQSHLATNGIDVVLSGGAVVAFYTSGKYVSLDIDLVNRYISKRSLISNHMENLGFKEVGRQFFHPETEFYVEFPPGPLSIGEDKVVNISVVELETGKLRLISPTDCVKDRLAWYYHAGDNQCLFQATIVSKEQEVDLFEIRDWSTREGKYEEYQKIKDQLGGR